MQTSTTLARTGGVTNHTFFVVPLLFDPDGSAIVVHAAEDDQVTDPTGNSGARMACGVIRKAR